MGIPHDPTTGEITEEGLQLLTREMERELDAGFLQQVIRELQGNGPEDDAVPPEDLNDHFDFDD